MRGVHDAVEKTNRTRRSHRVEIPELLTVNEVAQALRLSRSKVYELVASCELIGYRPGGRLRIPASAVRELLEDSRLDRDPVR